MSSQLSFFEGNSENTLEVVEVAYVGKRYTCADELFSGFNHLYAITFSYGLDFINKIVDRFDTAQIILGCEPLVKLDLKTVMAFQTRTLQELKKYRSLTSRIEEDTLSFWVAKGIVSHQKIFILFNDAGASRIIVGSPNLSRRSFSGEQRENITVFENDTAAFNDYFAEFETLKEFCTNEVVQDALYLNLDESPEENVADLPIIKEARTSNVGIVLDNDVDDEAEAAVEFVYDINTLSARYASCIPKHDTDNGKILITPQKVTELLRKCKQAHQKRQALLSQKPHFNIHYEEGTFSFNDVPYDFDIDINDVRQDLIHIDEYFSGFDAFIGDVERTKKIYFRLLNYLFLSPFIARLRYVADQNDFAITLFPFYAIINGPKSAGKTAFLETVLTMMFGRSYDSVGPNRFTKSGIWEYLNDTTGIPVYIDEVSRERFTKYAGEIIKYDRDILRARLLNHPTFVLTSNDLSTIDASLSKRVYYASVDIQLPNVAAAVGHKKMAEQRKKISTAFYREYLKRMYPKVVELIDAMNNFVLSDSNAAWRPDIFKLSSETIAEIFRDCNLECPSYTSVVSYDDYFGNNVIIENIRDKIVFEWTHNRKAFRVLKRQNRVEYQPGEKAYEAKRIKEVLPEILQAQIAGNKIVFHLDAAEQFFGIRFTTRLFESHRTM